MGRKHPEAGLYNPKRKPVNFLSGLKKSIKGHDAAEKAGCDLPTTSAIAKLPTILRGQYTQFKNAAKDVLIAAGCGAVYDRRAAFNSKRELVRRELERYRLSDRPLTCKAIDQIMQGTAYEATYSDSMKGVADPDDPAQRLALAGQAAAPDELDPYDLIRQPCGCCKTRSRKPHTNMVSQCGGKSRRNVGELESIVADLHEEVRALQQLSTATRAAVDQHGDLQEKNAADEDDKRKLSKLSLLAQHTPAASKSSSISSGKQTSIGSYFGKPVDVDPGSGCASSVAPSLDRDRNLDAIETQVAMHRAALDRSHAGKNGDPVPVGIARHQFGPKNQRKSGALPGVLPPGLRSNIDDHLRRLKDDDSVVGLTMSHARGSSIISGECGSRRGRPVTSNYHPNTKTMVVDWSMKWAKPALALHGYTHVPCNREGCGGITTPVTASSTAYGTRIHLVFDPGGSISASIARQSTCHGCKEHHSRLLKPGEVLSPTKYTFPHDGRTTLSRIPPELLNTSIVHPDFMNPAAGYWPSRGLSASMQYDVICKQGFEDVARKVSDAIEMLQDEIDDQHDADVLEWWTQLDQSVGDSAWAALGSSDKLRLMDQRAEYMYFDQFAVKGATLSPCTSRPTAVQFESMFLEFIERFRLPLVAEYQSTVPRENDGLSVDATFDVASRIGNKGDNLVTVTRSSDGSLVAMSNLKSGSGDAVAAFLGAVAQREGYPKDKSLILNIDDRKVMAVPGAASPYELKLLDATLAKAAVQDFFHVIKHFNSFFNPHHAQFHYLSSVKFRDCARVRVSELESEVDALLRNGKISSTVKFNRETHIITPDQPVNQATIDQMKESGLYHQHFSTGKDGRGSPVPYTLRSDLDMDDRLAAYEADFIGDIFEQSFTYVKNQEVVILNDVTANTTGVVAAIVPGAVAVGGLTVLLASGERANVTRDRLLPTDLALIWSKDTHRSTPRDQVRQYCDRFKFRMNRTKHGSKVLIASVDEFLHQIMNARKRLSLCRPPSGVPQYKLSINPATGEAHTWRGIKLYRQLWNTNSSENNHKRIQDIHESSNYTREMAGALTLLGVNDKNRRNNKRKGAPTPGHNHVWTSVRRKSRRIANEGVFGPADRTMPPCLKILTVPSAQQLRLAAPTETPLDQPGLCVWDRFDSKIGRGKESKSGAVAAPLPEREVRPAIGTGTKREQLGADSVKLAVTMSTELDAVQRAVEVCRAELIQGGVANSAAAAAKHRFGSALADIAYKFLNSNHVDPNVLPIEVRDTILSAVKSPVDERSSLSGQVTAGNSNGAGAVEGCMPVSSPGSSPDGKRKADESSPASMVMTNTTPPNSTTKPVKAARLAMTFADRNGKDNHPCTCGNHHVHIGPTVDTAVKLRGIPGHKGMVSGTVTTVRGSEATVRLDPTSAVAVETRDYVVGHSALVYPGTAKRCTSECRTQLLGHNGQCPIIGDRANIINRKGEAVGVLRCDGSNNRLHLKPNGQHALIGWAWM